jgi:dynactin complex subunit
VVWEILALTNKTKQGVCHTVALPFTLKSILRQKKNYGNSNISPKKCSKRNQNPSKYYNSITNLKFQHKPKISSFKNPYIKIDLLIQNPELLYSIMNLNTISLPC